MRLFLSYNSQDAADAQLLEQAIKAKQADAEIFFAPKSLRAGGYWLPALSDAIDQADGFVILVGERGLGAWQIMEYYQALDKRVKVAQFPLILVLREGCSAPGLPFVRQLHWILTSNIASEGSVAKILAGLAAGAKQPDQLWRYTAPYRGLSAMTEADSDFFFGRSEETQTIVQRLADHPERLILLVGNSGVGKSSLAQAGVMAALKRQGFGESGQGWPRSLSDSRQWSFIKFAPGSDALKNLVAPFVATWTDDVTDPAWEGRLKSWVEELKHGRATLSGLMDASQRRFEELGRTPPAVFCVYIDQGEEIYARGSQDEAAIFSRILTQSMDDVRLRVMMSIRSDFFGVFQNDEALYARHLHVNVPPLRLTDLQEVVHRPAKMLGAAFDGDQLGDTIAQQAAQESVKDAGALPLLSYLLDDMWSQMVRRGDGMLRLPMQSVELGGVLAYRAEEFVARRPADEKVLRRIMTLHLASVREESEPTRRRAPRSEFSEDEWRLISQLADHPHRLTVTIQPENAEAYAEVAHEAIFRKWMRLREWLTAERDFLVWKSGLDQALKFHANAGAKKSEALLMGLPLATAVVWQKQRPQDLTKGEAAFIENSARQERMMSARWKSLRQLVQQVILVGLVISLGLSASLWVKSNQLAAESDAARRSQSEYLAGVAAKLIQTGDTTTGTLVALEALPSGASQNDRPVVPVAAKALIEGLKRLQERVVLHGHEKGLNYAEFSPDGSTALTASDDGTVRVWSAETGAQTTLLTGHENAVVTAKFSPGGQLIATASLDGSARIWRASDGQQMAVLPHEDAVLDLAFSPDGSRITTGSGNGAVKLWKSSDGTKIADMNGHNYSVRRVAFSPDGKRIATGSDDSTARLWDGETGRPIHVLGIPVPPESEIATYTPPPPSAPTHFDAVWGLAFSPDGRRLLTGSRDWRAREWDVATGKPLSVYEGHQREIHSVAYNPQGDRFVTAAGGLTDSSDNTVRVWVPDVRKATPVDDGGESDDREESYRGYDNAKTLFVLGAPRSTDYGASRAASPVKIGHTGPVWAAVYNQDGQYIASAAEDNTARLWDAVAGSEAAVLRGHRGQVMSARFSPDGKRILTASKDGTARIWDVAPEVGAGSFQGHGRGIQSVAFSPDGRRVATASEDASVRLWETETGRPMAFMSHGETVWGAVFSPDGRRLLTASEDQTARLWDAETGFEITRIGVPADKTDVKAPSLNGLKGGSNLASVEAEVAEGSRREIVARGHFDNIWTARFSPDGQRIVTASEDGTARIWDANTGRQLHALFGHLDAVYRAEFSPDGTKVVTASRDWTARIWDVSTGKSLLMLPGHGREVRSAHFSPDGSRVVTSAGSIADAGDNTARVWDASTGSELMVLRGHGGVVWDAIYSHDGRRIASASDDGDVRLFDAQTGKQIAKLSGHLRAVRTVRFSPDDTRLVSGSKDDKARIWRLDSAQPEQSSKLLSGHTDAIWSAEFSSDGKKVITSSQDQTARLWNVETGEEIVSGWRPEQHIETAFVSPDGIHAVTQSGDGLTRLWNLTSRTLIAVFEGQTIGFDASSGAFVTTIRKYDGYDNYSDTNYLRRADSGLVIHTPGGLDLHFDASRTKLINSDGNEIKLKRSAETDIQDKLAKCDELAASPSDSKLPFGVPGVKFSELPAYEAIRACTAAMEVAPDDARIKFQLARALQKDEQDMPRAASLYAQAAAKGVPGAMSNLGLFYEKGLGVPIDIAKARAWYEKAAAESEPYAMLHLARIYEGGIGVTIDTAKAQVWRGAAEKALRKAEAIAAARSLLPELRLNVFKGTALIYNRATKSTIAELEGHQREIVAIAQNPNGLGATASRDGTARVWELATGKLVSVLEGHSREVRSVALSPDGRFVVTSAGGVADGTDNTARIWDPRSGKQLAVLKGHTAAVLDAVFSPDGKFVLTRSNDQTARLWSAADGTLQREFKGHEAPLMAAGFFAEDRIFTAAGDGKLNIWSAGGSVSATVANEPPQPIKPVQASFYPNVSRIAAPDRIMPLIERARQLIPRCLTAEERDSIFLDKQPPAWCTEKKKWPY